MGHMVWEHALNPDDTACTPTVYQDQVLVGVDPQPPTAPGNQVLSWYARALSASTGRLLWEHTSEPALGARVIHPVECDDASAYVCAQDELVALDRLTGTVRWSCSVRNAMPPHLHNGCLYASSGTELLVLDPSTGRVRRRRRCGADPRAVTVGPDGSLPRPSTTSWAGHGFALSGPGGEVAITSHQRGRITALRLQQRVRRGSTR